MSKTHDDVLTEAAEPPEVPHPPATSLECAGQVGQR
jgi:hypothetical protein